MIALAALRGLGETCPYLGPPNGQPPLKGACSDSSYDIVKERDDGLNCWIPKFARVVRDHGYTPRVVGLYSPPGYGSCGFTEYNVYWDVLFEGKSIPCGIYVADSYVHHGNPKDVLDMAVVGCQVNGGPNAPVQNPVATTRSSTAEKIATAAPSAAGAAPNVVSDLSTWDKLVLTFMGDSGKSGSAPATPGLSSIPTWAWVAGGVAVLFFTSKGGK